MQGTQMIIKEEITCKLNATTGKDDCASFRRDVYYEPLGPSTTSWKAAPFKKFNITLTIVNGESALVDASSVHIKGVGPTITGFWVSQPGQQYIYEILPNGTGIFEISGTVRGLDPQRPNRAMKTNALSFEYNSDPIVTTIDAGGRQIVATKPLVAIVTTGRQLLEGPDDVLNMIQIEGDVNSTSIVYDLATGEFTILVEPNDINFDAVKNGTLTGTIFQALNTSDAGGPAKGAFYTQVQITFPPGILHDAWQNTNSKDGIVLTYQPPSPALVAAAGGIQTVRRDGASFLLSSPPLVFVLA